MLSPTNTVGPGNNAGATQIITVAGSTYTGSSGSGFVINGQTLTPGGQVTIDNTVVSLLSGGTVAVVGGSTENLGPIVTGNPGGNGATPTFVLGGTTYTESNSQFVIAGQTLSLGGQITVGSTQVSFPPDGSVTVKPPGGGPVVGPSTSTIEPPGHGPVTSTIEPPGHGPVTSTSSTSSDGSGDGYGITVGLPPHCIIQLLIERVDS